MAVEKDIIINLDTKDAQKNVKDLGKAFSSADVQAAGGLDKFKESLKETKEETKDLKKEAKGNASAFKILDKFTGGLASKFLGFQKKIVDVVKSFGALRVAIAATGIGALILALTSLRAAFTRSEEGQKKFKKILGIVGSVVDNVLDVVANLGEAIIDTFLNPIDTLKSFASSIQEYVIGKVMAVVDGIGLMGSAISKVFSGDFKGALKDAQGGFSKLAEASPFGILKDGIDAATDSVKNFAKEVVSDAAKASKIADARAKAEIKARELTVERAKADREIAELREKAADKENFTAKERIEFLKQAGQISEEIANKEVDLARIRLEAKQVENSLAKSTTEDLNEQAQLEAEMIQKQTARLKLQKSLTAEVTTAVREEAAERDRIAKEQEAKDKEAEAKETERLNAIQKIRDDFAMKQKEKEAQSELEKLDLEEQKKLAELEKLDATEKEKFEVYQYYAGLRTDVEDKENKKKADLEKLRKQQILGDAKNTFNQIAQLAGEDSKVGKAFALASATISGVEGVQNAYTTAQDSPITTFFPGYPIVQAALAGAVAVKNIAAIKKVDPSGRGQSSVPSVSGGGAQAPSFNIVGATETSQLAEAIGEQEQQPVQAYVVANDVTTAQSLNNNIVEGATL